MSEPLPWAIPVYRVLTEVPMWKGVPRSFCQWNLISALLVGIHLRKPLLMLLNGALHLLAVWITKKDPYFFQVVREHIRITGDYEV